MIESLTTDSKYCAVYHASADMVERDPHAWEYIKRKLIQIYMGDLFPQMIDDGLYHVMKFDFYKSEVDRMRYTVEYRLVCKHSVARVQNMVIPELPEMNLSVKSMEKSGFKKACRYCGNALILSTRGACNACGGPAGE